MTALTKEGVKEAFDQWRLQKQSGEKIPGHLWDLVRALMNHHRPHTVIKCLHLSTKQMRRQGLLPLASAASKESSSFVNVKLSPLLNTSVHLAIRRADGAVLSYTAGSDEQLLLSIKAFLS